MKEPEETLKVAVATENRNKLREIGEIFRQLGREAEVYSAAQLGMGAFPPETAETFQGNASGKAEALYRFLEETGKTGYIVLADDSGICVEALGGAPGVHSARYAGEPTDDEANLQKLLSELEKTGDRKRRAWYLCAIAAILPGGERLFSEGRMDGSITREKAGTGGFGYDPIFYTPVYGRTAAQLTPEEKNAISHRGRAIRGICEKIAEKMRKEL